MRAGLFCLSLLFLLPSLAANAGDELPKRKPGLWEIQNAMNGAPSPTGPISVCVDAASDNLLHQQATGMASQCNQVTSKKEGDKYVVKSVCKLDKTTATTEGTFTGAFDSNYRGEMRMTYDPPIHGLSKMDMTLSAKWVGPCKPDQKAGDVIMPNMGPSGPKSINMQELMKMRDQMKRMQPPQ